LVVQVPGFIGDGGFGIEPVAPTAVTVGEDQGEARSARFAAEQALQ